VAISLKRVKTKEKLLWTAYRNSPNALSNGTIPDPKASRELPRDCGFAIYLPPVISGTGKATDFKFGGYIYRDNPNKSPLKLCRKGSVDESRDCPNFLGTPYYLRNG